VTLLKYRSDLNPQGVLRLCVLRAPFNLTPFRPVLKAAFNGSLGMPDHHILFAVLRSLARRHSPPVPVKSHATHAKCVDGGSLALANWERPKQPCSPVVDLAPPPDQSPALSHAVGERGGWLWSIVDVHLTGTPGRCKTCCRHLGRSGVGANEGARRKLQKNQKWSAIQ
jgi:hypothetical protein